MARYSSKLAAMGFLLGGLAFAASSGAAPIVVDGDVADFERNQDTTATQQAGVTMRAGASGSLGGGRNGIFMFDISSFAASGDTLTSADLRLTMVSLTGSPTFNVDLYGVGYSNSVATIPAAADFYEGTYGGDTTNTTGLLPIMDNFTPTGTANGSVLSTDATGDAALLSFLNARPAGSNIVFFRLVPDADAGTSTIGYNFGAANNTTAANRPMLGLNQQVPEPGAVALGAVAICLLGRRRRAR